MTAFKFQIGDIIIDILVPIFVIREIPVSKLGNILFGIHLLVELQYYLVKPQGT